MTMMPGAEYIGASLGLFASLTGWQRKVLGLLPIRRRGRRRSAAAAAGERAGAAAAAAGELAGAEGELACALAVAPGRCRRPR